MLNGNGKSLESWIWDAACSIRGAQEAPKFKDFILPLIFTKRLCDVFDDELNRIAERSARARKAFKLVEKDHKLVRFYLPLEPTDPGRAGLVRHPQAHRQDRRELTTHLHDIAKANPLLEGIIDRMDFNATTHGQRDIDDDRLSNLIERISEKRLGLNDVEADIIGRSYEYLIRKFAEGSGQCAGEFFTPAGSRPRHGPDHGPRAGHERLRPLLRLGRPAHQLRARAGREDEAGAAGPTYRRPLKLYGQEYVATHLGHGEHEHDHPRHGGEIEIGDTFKNPKFRATATACRPSTASSPIPCGTRTGSRKRTTTPTSSAASRRARASPAARPTGAGCSTSSPA